VRGGDDDGGGDGVLGPEPGRRRCLIPDRGAGATLNTDAGQRGAMRALAVVGGSDAQVAAAVADVVDALGDRGRVATVTAARRQQSAGRPAVREPRAGAERSVVLAGDGTWWAASGGDRTLDDVLDDLAAGFDYVVAEGVADADLPVVAVGDHSAADPVVAAADADALDADAVVDAVEATDPRETLDSLVARALDHADSEFAGAVATFTGRVRRRDDPDDAPTEHLEFERYDAVAEQRLAAIRSALTDRDGVYDVRMHHRTGVVPAGEDVVHVVVLAGHREEAFAAVSDGIDRLKDEVPLFKKEVTVDESFWRHDPPR